VKDGNSYIENVSVVQNAGTRLAYGSVEGPYIVYNAETDYYYLFVSYGDLFKNYNVRVGRSRNITGPYTYSLNDSLSMETKGGNDNNHGNKVLGGYYFDFDSSVSRMATGHCSVLKDTDGKWLLFNHVRNTGNRNYHYIQVHQLFFNEKGWPVILPNVYAGEKLQDIGAADLNGNWQVITFMKNDFIGTNNTIVSKDAMFNDKQISGAFTGTYKTYEGGAIKITLTGNEFDSGEEAYLGDYFGYVVSGFDYDNRKSALFFTAMNEYGFEITGQMLLTTVTILQITLRLKKEPQLCFPLFLHLVLV
jgi:arabinan endo-1,5-alpha-L-arabinosidase